MGADELINEEAFEPEKLFNEEEYSTIVINRDGFTNKQNTAADLIEDLLEPNNTRPENEDLFKKLKETGATQVLVNAIHQLKNNSNKAKLIAACWECGLDFTAYYLDFVKLGCHKDFNVALEALTVVESIEGQLSEAVLQEALAIINMEQSGHSDLIPALRDAIEQRLI